MYYNNLRYNFMKLCEHKKVVFAGVQETLSPLKPLLLFRCLECGSTITLKKEKSEKVLAKKEISK
jgi:hypothetical protein